MIVALVAIGDIFDGQQLRLLLVRIVEQHGPRRTAQRIRKEPPDLRFWVSLEQAGKLRLAAHQNRLGAGRIERSWRIENVQFDVGRRRDSVGILCQTLEGVLIELAASSLKVQQRALFDSRLFT